MEGANKQRLRDSSSDSNDDYSLNLSESDIERANFIKNAKKFIDTKLSNKVNIAKPKEEKRYFDF